MVSQTIDLPSATVRQVDDVSSIYPRDLSDTCSGVVRVLFECCSGFSEAHPNNTRRNAEGVPNKSRSGLEADPKETRIASEETRSFFYRFLGRFKARIKYRCSKDVVLFTQFLRKIDDVTLKYNFGASGAQYPYLFSTTTTQAQPKDNPRITQQRPKDDPRLTQQRPKDDPRLTQQQPKDDPSASLGRPSLRTAYRQGSPKVDTRNTQETANNDTRNVRLMYRECTVSVRGVYRKGTKEVLRRYWRATKDPLNACTSVVHQQYSKRRRVVGVEAMTNRVTLCLAGLLCFMLFNLSDAWAQSAETRTAEGQMEIKPLQIGDTTTRGHYAIPHQDTVVIGAMRQNFDVDRFPLEKYHIEESLLHKLRIGDLLPEELLKLPLTVISRDGNTDTLCLKEFGDQLIVLDFWAGWCAPCVRSMEKWETYMDSLKGNYAFFGAHIDYACKALPFIEKKEWNSPSIIGMNGYVLARSFFDRIVAGKLVWIKNQRLLALTGVDGYDRRMVQDLIDGKIVQLPVDSTWTY